MKNFLRKWLEVDLLEEKIGDKVEEFFTFTVHFPLLKKQKTLYEEIEYLHKKIEKLEEYLGIEFKQFETRKYFKTKKEN
jgi:hypothetical protein